ncbi:mitogen-activated protein kinase-binding protein 1 isoform X1 [Microplitis demolitor]|uniref:mitogen-activated protein kinase-binding protein 1 isoform X1 n=1 Tax=Microplitis demolitor TaxID=69319 RepID=UPI0006D4EFDB|nr:mitogen-activated protein kinase-binding protein 1 isoform X1 [Microplitis demolitor]XP_053594933.1 mitogen-activated protein kinase-binding protein 1 isoform X1 [Microplitis demolitor]XP_053594934.1 mitogen-activated protein kinase-binding protein 1 isoform X1 [Microplitis demolitor]
MDPPLTSKVLRAPNLKRGQENIRIHNRIKLERVLGVTVSSNAALDCDTTSEIVAYPAGCTVVLFNPRKNTQTHVLNSCKKTVTSLALAGDGRLLVTGECGHMPNVRVWDISDQQNAIQIAEFSSHKYGINCVAFSPSNKYVVSIGSQHDMIVNVWDWRNNVKVASNKVSSKVKAVSFAENGSYFVTVGNRHVKFWYLEYTRSAKYKEPVPLMGRSAILGEQRNNDFVDVTCGRGEMADSTYAITKTGLLCEFNNRRLLDKWVELRTSSANCMAVGEKFIFIGCAEGIVRCFSPVTLQFITTLPRTHYLGVDVACGLSISHMSQHPTNARYPDAVALAFDELNNKLTCVYNDHSIYVWDIRDIKRVGKSHSFLYHSACIWGVEMYPTDSESINDMPSNSFITCSSDDTIRVWNLKKDFSSNQKVYNRNIYSNELLKVLYVDPELTYLKDLDLATAGSTEKSDTSYDGRNGVRSIRVSPDGKHIASGDRSGNIRIHDVATLDELCLIEAHDAEVLCLEYSKYSRNTTGGPRLLASASRDRLIHVFNVDEGYNFLQTLDDHSSSITAVRFFKTTQSDKIQMVSCGADKSIIFRQLQMTPGGSPQFVRDHNAQGKTTLYDMEVDSGQKHVLTACQDRNIRVYNVATGKHSKTFKGSVGEDGSLIKVVLDASGIYVATSCTDKTLCVYDYYSGECMATMLGHSELVTGLRFSPDCRHLVSASGDGCIFVWSIPHDMVVTMQARLAQQAMRAGQKLHNLPNGLAVQLNNETFGPPSPEFFNPNANSTIQTSAVDYRFSVGQLPHWAKKQINTNTNIQENISSSVRSVGVDMPKGRWAQRVQQTDGITVKSVYDSDEIIHFPPSRSVIDSDGGCGGAGGSKDSSIDSGTETKCSSDYRRETIIIKKEEEENVFAPCPDSYRELTEDLKQMTGGNVTITRGSNITELTHQSRIRHCTDDSSLSSFKLEDHESTEHDGDVEDYSEGENGTTSSEKSHNLIYYPPIEDTVSNQFKVNAMDVEELRRSMRRGKKIKIGDSNRSELTTASGSQDDSDSEGGASTPSAERNPLSILSEASSEGYDQVSNQTHREKYLKNAFESLSGADEPTNRKNTSISSQFHGRFSGGQNQGNKIHQTQNINPIVPKNTKLSADVTKNREELQRRIEETRRKLQSVGYKSSLKSSQSISDLSSHLPDRHHRQSRIGSGNNKLETDGRFPSKASDSKDEIEDKGMRRACSLSDLSVSPPNRLLHGPIQVSGKLSIKNSNISSRNGTGTHTNSGLPSRYTSSKSHSTYMTRSSSVGVLNQHSDSESDAGIASSGRNFTNSTTNNRISGLMRPTISSQNKINHQTKPHSSSSSNLPMVLRRRGMQSAYSSVNLSQVGNQEDSSSEDTSSNGNGGKPTLPPRPRSINIDLSANFNSVGSSIRRSGSNTTISTSRLINNASGQMRLSSRNQLDQNPQKPSAKEINVANAELSPQLCNTIADELTRTADNVVQLYKRLAMDSSANSVLGPIDRDTMLRGLESSVNEAMQTLRLVAASTTNKETTDNDPSVVNEATETFKELLAGQDQGKVVNIMQQYSEMLLSMMQQRMSGTQPNHA